MGGRVGILGADGVCVVLNLSNEVFEAGVGGNCGFELLVEILYVLLLERTVCGPEVSQNCERYNLGETGVIVFERLIKLLRDILLNLGLNCLVEVVVLFERYFILQFFQMLITPEYQ